MIRMPSQDTAHFIAINCPKCGEEISYESWAIQFNCILSCAACGILFRTTSNELRQALDSLNY